MHARGLLNSQAIQYNLDWIWPFWVNRQFDPRDESFVPRAFSLTHINLTHRNWTSVGLPDRDCLGGGRSGRARHSLPGRLVRDESTSAFVEAMNGVRAFEGAKRRKLHENVRERADAFPPPVVGVFQGRT